LYIYILVDNMLFLPDNSFATTVPHVTSACVAG